MSVVFADTFDYGDNYWAGDKHWTAYDSVQYVTGRYGTGNAVYGASLSIAKTLSAITGTFILAFNYKTPSSGSGETYVWRTFCGATEQITLKIDKTTLKFVLYRGGTLIATSTNQYTVSTNYWLSWKTYLHDSSGTSELRINGSSSGWVDFSGDTMNAASDYIDQIWAYLPGTAQYDDVILMDTSGSVMNDHITERKGGIYVPNGAGGYTQWDPSTGSNYQCVDETAYNSDTDYVSTSTATERDSYTHATISGFSSIDFTQLRGVIRKDDVDAHTASLSYRRSSTNYDGTATTVSASYTEICRIDHVDPATSSAWTQTNLNDTEIGVLLDT